MEDAKFQTDFWLVRAVKEDEFLRKKIDNENVKLILLGFQIEDDLHLYERMKEEFLMVSS